MQRTKSQTAFGGKVEVFTDNSEMLKRLQSINYDNTALLMMSSGTFGGLDVKSMATELINSK